MAVYLANAPVSFGIFELSPPGFIPPDPDVLITKLAEIGYRGIDLGPVGYLGRGEQLCNRLRRNHMGLAGGWVDLPFFDQDAYRYALPRLDAALAVFDEATGTGGDLPAPKPTLAITARPFRQEHPGGGATHPEIGLDDDGWRVASQTITDAVRRCAEHGYTATFHPHLGTDVESPAEIQRLIDSTDIGVTLDTGHLIAGGGDPVSACARWGNRINHLHIKDARPAVIAAQLAVGGGLRSLWAAGVFCSIGTGDLDLPGLLTALRRAGYAGWAVVEQDVMPGPDSDFAAILADQRHNMDALLALGFGAPDDPATSGPAR